MLPIPSQSAAAGAKMPPDICIVAGGSSARGFDFRKIASSKIITVNDSFLSVPRSDAVVSIDRNWINDRACELIRYPGELFTLFRPGEARPWTRCGQRCWTFRTEPGLSDSWAEVFSVGCSGSAAINVAYLMRPRSIGLIGFDYDGSGRHWFDDHKNNRTNRVNTWAMWADGFAAIIPQLAAAGIEVINYNPHSRITAFERRALDTIGQ